MFVWRISKTSFLEVTRTLALSSGASVSDMRGLHIYSLAGLDQHVGQCSRDLKTSLFFFATSLILQHRLIFSETHTGYTTMVFIQPHLRGGPNLRDQK